MAVYVDEEMIEWRNRRWCHLVADSLAELHDFAQKIGLKREWFQPASYPHYDVTDTMRERALRFGALPGNRQTIMRCAKGMKAEQQRNAIT